MDEAANNEMAQTTARLVQQESWWMKVRVERFRVPAIVNLIKTAPDTTPEHGPQPEVEAGCRPDVSRLDVSRLPGALRALS